MSHYNGQQTEVEMMIILFHPKNKTKTKCFNVLQLLTLPSSAMMVFASANADLCTVCPAGNTCHRCFNVSIGLVPWVEWNIVSMYSERLIRRYVVDIFCLQLWRLPQIVANWPALQLRRSESWPQGCVAFRLQQCLTSRSTFDTQFFQSKPTRTLDLFAIPGPN